MDPEVANFGIVAVIIVVMVAALSRVTISLVRGLARKSPASELPNARQMEQRFDQLQQSVDAIAVEVERIAEAQRFSAKLLAEKNESIPR
ncbi:MAG TPA: hypothetical protein VGG76_08260 [Gemmatimonadaceae bacterium]